MKQMESNTRAKSAKRMRPASGKKKKWYYLNVISFINYSISVPINPIKY